MNRLELLHSKCYESLISQSSLFKEFSRRGFVYSSVIFESRKEQWTNQILSSENKVYIKKVDEVIKTIVVISKVYDLFEKIILVQILGDDSLIHFDELLLYAKMFDRRIKKVQFNLPIDSHLTNTAFNMGGVCVGYQYLGRTAIGFTKINRIHPSNITLKKITKKDHKSLVEIEFMAHSTSLTSRVRDLEKSNVNHFISFLFENNFYITGLFLDNKLIGFAVPAIKHDMGHIMTIAIHPDFQGRDLSQFLYFSMLNYWKSHNIEYYTGVTTTQQVQRLSCRLDRSAYGIYLNL